MRTSTQERILLLLCLVFSFVATHSLSYFVFDHIPHVQDSIAQVFQAKIFASGDLYASSHPLNEFFDYSPVINDGKWYSQYPPGHSLFLMFGVLLGAPWIVNPLLGTLSVLVIYLIGKEAYGRNTGSLAAMLTVLSPFFLFMSAGFMSHTSSMLTGALFVLFLIKTLKHERSLYAALSGIALGLCILVRPYSALAVALPFILYALALSVKKPKTYLRLFLLLSFCTSAGVGLLLLYNQITNGHPLTFGYSVLYGTSHGLGLGRGSWGPPLTLARGLDNLWDSIQALSFHLFGWFRFSLLPIVLLLLSRRMQKWCYLFLLSFVSLCIAYVFYWYHDLCFGPRFLYEALPFLTILSARGLIVTTQWTIEKAGWNAFSTDGTMERKAIRARIATAIMVGSLFLYSAIVSFPILIKGDGSPSFWQDRRYGSSYWGVDAYLSEYVASEGITNAVVFVDFDYPVFDVDPYLWYGSGFLHLSPSLDDDVLYARDLGERNELLMRYYPDREHYLYQGELQTGTLTPIEASGDD